MLSCRQAQELFFEFLDKELSVEDADHVREHLDACGRCTDSMDSAQAFVDCVKAKLRNTQLPDGLSKRISTALSELES
ncbi:MAG: zf-HC2 domain-containing protein [Armatimonadetes bacterium]|nr:zf-HC2 domain-containing protein [Armatimonadota bacterium]